MSQKIRENGYSICSMGIQGHTESLLRSESLVVLEIDRHDSRLGLVLTLPQNTHGEKVHVRIEDIFEMLRSAYSPDVAGYLEADAASRLAEESKALAKLATTQSEVLRDRRESRGEYDRLVADLGGSFEAVIKSLGGPGKPDAEVLRDMIQAATRLLNEIEE